MHLPPDLSAVHFVGIGGIGMSAAAKILHAAGVRVSGSDLAENEQVRALRDSGIAVAIGEDAANIPTDTQLLVHTSAAPESNRERVAAMGRGIPEMTNFAFLGEWFRHKKVVLVCGTHGKSTTTAMLGLMLIEAGLDPTVLVGSRVPAFPDGNLRLGASDLVVIEGDEYARHFLEFHPYAVALLNVELDHTDIFPTLDVVMDAFRELLLRIGKKGILAANVGDLNVRALLGQESVALLGRDLSVVHVNGEAPASWAVRYDAEAGATTLSREGSEVRLPLHVPGRINALNAAMAASLALSLGADADACARALDGFGGIWRRFEKIGERDGILFVSDYAHHPTAVRETLKAAHEAYPDKRVVACFQPHHRKRTRDLFFEFEAAFDRADVLVLAEIYEPSGRTVVETDPISSEDFLEVLARRDAEAVRERLVAYAPDAKAAVARTMAEARPGDIVLFMAAGDLDAAVRDVLGA